MKFFCGSAHNITFELRQADKTILPSVELVLMLHEPIYNEVNGAIRQKQQVSTERVTLTPTGILSLLQTLTTAYEQITSYQVSVSVAADAQEPQTDEVAV